MDQPPNTPTTSVSNLIPVWDEAADGGSWHPDHAGEAVRQSLRPPSMVEQLLDEPAPLPTAPHYDTMHVRDIARELLRARLVAIAERRERRSAYEIVFILLAASVAVMLAAPPLVQVLLAAHGVQV